MLTWANRITLARICLIPFFVMAILQVHGEPESGYRYVAVGLFLFMALTDAVDGIVARARGEKSRFGKILDPLADKFLLTTACVLLALDGWPAPRLPNWLPVLVISRDVIIVVGTAVIFIMTGAVKAGPTFLGKVTTTVQMLMVMVTLLNNHCPELVVRLFWALTALLTCASGLQYVYRGTRQINFAGAPASGPAADSDAKNDSDPA